MVSKPPRRNLPPESEAWGRDVDNRIQQLENSLNLGLTNLSATSAANASSLAAISQLVESQNDVLTELAYVVANQMSSSIGNNSVSNFAVTTTYTTRGQVTLPRPDWATNALVVVTGYSTAVMNSTGTGNTLSVMRVQTQPVGGSFSVVTGPTITCMPHAAGSAGTTNMSSGQSTWSAQFSGLTSDVTGIVGRTQVACYNNSWYPAHPDTLSTVNTLVLWTR